MNTPLNDAATQPKASAEVASCGGPGKHRESPPLAASLPELRASDANGAMHLSFSFALTAVAIVLSCSPTFATWLAGQAILSFALLSWFAVLHEAGHKMLFRSPRLNFLSGQIAGTLALIPYESWRLVHAQHHFWAGWHDLDPTTSQTLPRKLGFVEKWLINLSWWLWIPAFSVIYRLQNYWHLPRLWGQFSRSSQRWRIGVSVLICCGVYAAIIAWQGPARVAYLLGLGLYLSLVMQDLLILSQHSHIPMPHSEGRDVRPFPPRQQEQYTRSLVCPRWFSRLILLNIDAHELHHMYPRVPGYWLHTIPYRPRNALSLWQWIWRAKRIRGDVLLFQNRDLTGDKI